MAQKKSVLDALQVIEDNFDTRNERNGIIRSIQSLFEEAFIVSDPSGSLTGDQAGGVVGPRKLNAQRLYQALWRTANRMKPLDFLLQGTGRPPSFEKIVTAGVATVMDRGGYDSALRDKNGAFFSLLLYGDAFIQTGTNEKENDNNPITFRTLSNDNIYTDNFATAVRATGSGSSCSKMVIIYTYSKDEFDKTWPGNKQTEGQIQRNQNEKEQIKTSTQELKRPLEVEVAYSYDLTTQTYVVFAGSGSTVLQEEKGKNYPFIKNKEPYIPVSQFICMPSSEGLYNHGIGAMIYKLAIIQRQLLNMEVGHIEQNTLPITHVNVPQDQVTSYFNKLKLAHQMVAQGQRGFVAMEFDPNNPNASRVSHETMLTQNLFNEWQAVYDRLDREIRRLGINIDELEAGGTQTATEILALEENSNAFVKQIMEYNASESQHLVEITMDQITEFIPNSSKIPLNLTTEVEVESPNGKGMLRPDRITLGMVSKELKDHNYFVEVNSRTGAIPSGALLRARLNNNLLRAQPGSPASIKINQQLAALDGLDIKGEEFLIQQAPAAPPEGEAPSPEPTGTDRLTINPRAKEQVAAL